MKRTVLIIFAAILVAGIVQAAEFAPNLNPAAPPTSGPFSPDLPNITQSNDPLTIAAGSLACADSGPPQSTTENHYMRRFFLNADDGIVNPYDVTSVDFGVESATVITAGVPLNITLYTIANGAAFTFANLTQIGTASTTIPDGTSLQMFNLAVSGYVDDPIGKDLVVDIWTPDGTVGPDFSLFIGSNGSGETQPGYLAAADCGLTEPTAISSISATMFLVMTVNGDEITGPTPTPPPPSGAAVPVPSLNKFGILAMVLLLVGVGILVMWRRS